MLLKPGILSAIRPDIWSRKLIFGIRKHGCFCRTIGLAIIYWLTDTSIHRLVYGEKFQILPDDPDEIWMRAFIVILLLAFGLYADYKRMQLSKLEEEKRRIFRATVMSTQHILNNMLNNLTFFKIEMDENNAFSDDIKRLYNETLDSGTNQVKRLSEVEDMSEEKIKQSVFPQ